MKHQTNGDLVGSRKVEGPVRHLVRSCKIKESNYVWFTKEVVKLIYLQQRALTSI